MTLTLVDVGADQILKKFFNDDPPSGGNALTLKLYTNDLAPVDTHTAGSYAEASGGGYAAKTLSSGSWTVSAGADPSRATYANQTFTFTGALDSTNVVYGYFIVDDDDVLIWAERLGASFTPVDNGDQLEISPLFELSKGTPS